MSELNPQYTGLVRGMLTEDIVKFGKFRLKSGKESVAYVNLREMISIPRLFEGATEAYVETLDKSDLLQKNGDRQQKQRHLMAIPEAATYYGGAVGNALRVSMLYHRVKEKEHGQPRAVEGRYDEGDEVVLLDDVVTTAGAKLEETRALAEMGLTATSVVVLVDREQGGRAELEHHGLEFAAAMTLSGIAKYAFDEGLAGVTQSLYDELLGELNPAELSN